MHTILVIGGYGFFGARISTALAQHPGIRVLIGGRSRGALSGSALHGRSGCHRGGQFVAGIDALDSAARARGVTVTSGASTVPALSAAVVDRFLPEFERLDSIRIGISSGAKVPGLAAMRGVFSYAGRPIATLQEGTWVSVYGWRGLERHRFPKPLGSRWLATCEVPDLDVLPRRYPDAQTVIFKAGFASAAGQLLVWTLAGLVEMGLLASLSPFASPLNRLSGGWSPC